MRARKKPIQEMAISEFKTKCFALLKEVSKTKAPLRITRRGKAIADVFPSSCEDDDRRWIGSMAGSVDIMGYIVAPVIDASSFEALKN